MLDALRKADEINLRHCDMLIFENCRNRLTTLLLHFVARCEDY